MFQIGRRSGVLVGIGARLQSGRYKGKENEAVDSRFDLAEAITSGFSTKILHQFLPAFRSKIVDQSNCCEITSRSGFGLRSGSGKCSVGGEERTEERSVGHGGIRYELTME